VPAINAEKFAEFTHVRTERYDEVLSIGIPRCEVVPQNFDLHEVSEVILANVSRTITVWRVSIAPEGCTVDPPDGVMMPGGKMNLKVASRRFYPDVQFVLSDIEGGSPLGFEFTNPEL
jgi:hypothetical protein